MDLTEEKIWEALKGIKISNPLAFKFSSGITRWLCPPGVAIGFEEFSNRGRVGPLITCWPRLERAQYNLFEGIGTPKHGQMIVSGKVHLWWQEAYVYSLERRSALIRAMENMDKIFPIPRDPEHLDNDVEPYPEDFGRNTSRMVVSVMIESIERWLENN